RGAGALGELRHGGGRRQPARPRGAAAPGARRRVPFQPLSLEGFGTAHRGHRLHGAPATRGGLDARGARGDGYALRARRGASLPLDGWDEGGSREGGSASERGGRGARGGRHAVPGRAAAEREGGAARLPGGGWVQVVDGALQPGLPVYRPEPARG